MNPREAAEHLFGLAKEVKVRFPKIFDDSKIRQTCGATVVCYTYSIDCSYITYTILFPLALDDF